MAIINMSQFWDDWGVACGNQNANNWYDCFYGLTFGDGFVCANATDFFNHVGYSRYDFWRSYDGIDSEYDFYRNTDDPNIYDFKTFYEYAPSYFPANCNIDTSKFIIAFRNNSQPYKSYDGINWELINIDILSSYVASVNCNATKPGAYTLMGGANNVIRYNWGSDTWENFPQSITIVDMAYNPDTDEFIGISRDTTTNNIHISSDYGETWTTYSSITNQLDCIGYSPGLSKYYASNKTVGGKRISTSSDGITWIPIITNVGGGAATYDGRYYDSIDVNGDIIFIPSRPATGSDAWFIKTSDLVTFNNISYSFNSDLRNGAYNVTNDIQVYMGEVNRQNLFGDVQGGLTISNAPTTYQYTDVKYYSYGNIMVVGTRTSALADVDKRILYSTDNGANWTKVDASGVISNILVIE